MPSIFTIALFSVCLAPLVSATAYEVAVGKNEVTGQKGMGFSPSVVNPVVGDIVSFQFQSGTHSVVQSTFDHPCTPMDGGYNSGVNTVPDSTALGASGLPVAQLYINDTIPQWFFDQAGGQCQQGALFAVNPTLTQNVTAFKANAAKDTPPPTSTASSAGSATGSATASGSKKSSAAIAKYDVAVSGAAAVLLTALSFLN